MGKILKTKSRQMYAFSSNDKNNSLHSRFAPLHWEMTPALCNSVGFVRKTVIVPHYSNNVKKTPKTLVSWKYGSGYCIIMNRDHYRVM